MSLPVAILAGGFATRLQSVAGGTPKSLIEVAGRPFAEHQIQLLRNNGVTDIVFLVGHLGSMVQEALGDGSRWGVRLRYVFDGDRALGTGGALLKALPEIGEAFLVLYGDSYLECDYAMVQEAFLKSGASGLMTVYRNDNLWDRSNVQFEDGRLICYDKERRTPEMRHIDYGLGAFRRSAFEGRIEGEAFDLVTIYQDLLAKGDLVGFEVNSRFFEIGSPSGLDETTAYLARKAVVSQ